MKKTTKFATLALIFLISICAGCGGGTSNNPYSVTYDGNGNTSGTVPIDTTSYEAGQTVTVLGNTGTLAKTGFTYSGWNTAADGSGTTYTQSQTFAMGSANVTLYAKWTSNPTYTVTYDGNGNTSGTVPTDTTNYEAGQTVTVLGNTGTLSKTGLAYSGWNTAADGSGTTYTHFAMGSANVTLYAKWDESGGIYDTAFNSGGAGANGYVYAIAIQSDGKILVGGAFTQYNGANVSAKVMRLNTDGTVDNTFNSGGQGANGNVYSIAIQDDGKILIGGVFTQYNGSGPRGITRLNSDGTLDDTFNTGGIGSFDTVLAIAIQDDGKILFGGQFTKYNDIVVPYNILRLESDGTRDSTFSSESPTGTNDAVYSIAIQNDDKILIGGAFTQYRGAGVPWRIIRLSSDGTLDGTFNSGGIGSNGDIRAIAIQDDGKILIGGPLTAYNSTDIPAKIARLSTGGTIDTTFNNGGAGGDDEIRKISLQDNGKILIGGGFTTYNGSGPARISRLLNSGDSDDGTIDDTFNLGGAGADNILYSLALQADGKIIIGGTFTEYNGEDVPNYIIRLE